MTSITNDYKKKYITGKEDIITYITERKLQVATLSTLIIILGLGLTTGSILSSENSSGGLVAEYRFDTGSGNTAYDTSGNNDGTINGASWTEGVKGKALSFDGNDDYIESSSIGTFSSNGRWTVSLWFKADDISKHTHFTGVPSSHSDGWTPLSHFGLRNSELTWWDSTGDMRQGKTSLESGRWYHTVIVGRSDSVEMYLNGREENNETSNIENNIGRFTNIGRRQHSSDRFFDGKIDNFRTFNTDLKKSEIKSLYNSGSWRIGAANEGGDPSKVLDMSFQHQENGQVLDTSGQNNHGTPQNGASQESAGGCKVGRCYSFDGSDDAVNLEDTVVLEREGSTISWWMKPSQTSSTGLFNSGIGGVDNYISARSNTLTAETRKNCNGFYFDQFTKSDKWNHYSIVLENSKAYLYENGKFLGEATSYRKDSCNGAEATQLLDNIDVNYIGTETSYNPYYSGKIDQVKIFDRSLSQQEIIEKTQGLDSDGAVLDMRFNRDGGDKVHDFSGEKNHGTLQPHESAGPGWVDGVTGNALRFDGKGDQVYVGGSEKYAQKSASISLWLKIKDDDSQKILTKSRYWNPRTAGFAIAHGPLSGLGDKLGFKLSDGGFTTNDNNTVLTAPHLEVDKWYHVAVKYDQNAASLYLNGEREDTSSTSHITDYTDSHGLKIAADNIGTGNVTIDKLKIFPHKISDSKIQELYSTGKSKISYHRSSSEPGLQDGLVLSQTFDRIETCDQSNTISCPSGMSGEVSVDESGEANHGELVNGPTQKTGGACKVGGCLGFDGIDDHVLVGNEKDLNFSRDDGFTLSAWANIPEDEEGMILSKMRDSNTYRGYGLWLRSSNDLDGWLRHDAQDSEQIRITSSKDIPRNEWVHLTMNYDGSSKASGLELYVNGKKVSSTIEVDNLVGDIETRAPFDIGARNNGGSEFINGKIDQVRIYNRSLSDEKVWKLYTRGRDRESGEKVGPVAHYPMQTESSPLRDIAGGNHGDLNLLGESGTFNTSDGEWKTIRFERSYQDPVVVGTTNTQNGESGLSFEARNVDSGSAEMRLCESEGETADGCDTHGTERAGYVVIDAASTDDIPGIEAGTFEIDSEIDSKTNTISYSESFSTAPYVMANVNSDNGRNPVEARVTDYSASDFTAGICYQNSNENCDSNHPTEKVGYFALEPGNLPFEQVSEVGSTGNSVSGSSWTSQSFSDTYSEPPVLVVSTVSEDGGHELEIDEGRNVDSDGAEVRYCEQEGSDGCEGHTSEEVAWFAAEEGLLTYTNGRSPRYVDSSTGKALEFDGNDDSVRVGDTEDMQLTGSLSICMWMNPDDIAGQRENPIDKAYGGEFSFTLEDETGGVLSTYFGSSGSDTTPYAHNQWENVVSNNEWSHICWVRNNSQPEVHLYKDGDDWSNYQTKDGWETPSVSTEPLIIGNGYKNSFDGGLNDLRIYPYALDQSEVKQIMNGGGVSIG